MEDTLGDTRDGRVVYQNEIVLILVLMEDTLGVIQGLYNH